MTGDTKIRTAMQNLGDVSRLAAESRETAARILQNGGLVQEVFAEGCGNFSRESTTEGSLRALTGLLCVMETKKREPVVGQHLRETWGMMKGLFR
jgi:hypothetical protein